MMKIVGRGPLSAVRRRKITIQKTIELIIKSDANPDATGLANAAAKNSCKPNPVNCICWTKKTYGTTAPTIARAR